MRACVRYVFLCACVATNALREMIQCTLRGPLPVLQAHACMPHLLADSKAWPPYPAESPRPSVHASLRLPPTALALESREVVSSWVSIIWGGTLQTNERTFDNLKYVLSSAGGGHEQCAAKLSLSPQPEVCIVGAK